MKPKTIAYALALLITSAALAVEVNFKWDNPSPDSADGSTLFVVDRKSGATNTFEAPKGASNIVVNIDPGTLNDVFVKAWADTVNPDGSRVRLYSEPSNVLDVKVPGKSGNLVVK